MPLQAGKVDDTPMTQVMELPGVNAPCGARHVVECQLAYQACSQMQLHAAPVHLQTTATTMARS
jgi:hypothetical protein